MIEIKNRRDVLDYAWSCVTKDISVAVRSLADGVVASVVAGRFVNNEGAIVVGAVVAVGKVINSAIGGIESRRRYDIGDEKSVDVHDA